MGRYTRLQFSRFYQVLVSECIFRFQMKITRTILFIFSLIVLATSCIEKEIEYQYSFDGPSIVVTGALSPSGVEVYLQETVDPMNPVQDQIQNAHITILNGHQIVAQLIEVEPGHYFSQDDFVPTHDLMYSLQIVTSLGGTLLSNQQKLVKPVLIDTCYYVRRTSNKGNDYLYMVYSDPAGIQNYYVSYKRDEYGKGQLLDNGIDPDLLGTPESDDLFDGEIKTVINKFNLSYAIGSEFFEKDSIQLKLYSFSEDLANYLIAIDESNFTYDNAFFEQPSFPKSYITNGFGIFGSVSVDLYMLRIH